MFAVSFTVLLLITVGINGQSNDIDTLDSGNVEKGYPFGKLRIAEDGKNEELIPTVDNEKLQLSQDQLPPPPPTPSTLPSSPVAVQPLPSPCIGSSAGTKLAHPKDKTKYIQCRDEFHYEVYTCPNGGDYNQQTNSCDLTVPIVDRCEQEKPCLNDGQCSVLSDSTFKCTCRADWTGDRCETPLNSCVMKPCGPNAECRSLKTGDYDQDYVCVCHGTKGYGLNCQEAVPNPCLTTTEQFFPYAFSQHAYIQCDGELIYFQPCGPILYWNQEEKICDRKRPAKIDLPALLTKYALMSKESPQEKEPIIKDDITLTTTESTQQQKLFGMDKEAVGAFIPARVASREQLMASINDRQGFSRSFQQKNQNRPTQSIIRQPTIIQSQQNQPWSQNTQQQWTPTFTGSSSINQFDQQKRNFIDNNQFFDDQQPLMQDEVPDQDNNQDKNAKGKQLFGGASQTWQGQQGGFQTATPPSNAGLQQGFQSQNTQTQIPSWQHPPNPQFGGIQSPQSGGFNSQTPSWQNPPTGPVSSQFPNPPTATLSPQFPNPHQQPFIETGVVPQNGGFQQGIQSPSTQFGGAQSSQTAGFPPQNTQNFGQQQPTWQGSQTFHNQQQFQNPVTAPPSVGFQQGQFGGVQSPQSGAFQGQNTQTFPPQPSWQGSQTFGGQQPSTIQSPSTQFGGVQPSQSVGFPPQNTQNFGQQQQFQQPWQTQQQFQNFQNPGAQFGGAQSPGFPSQNTQNFGQQPWQKSQGKQNQTAFSNQIPPPIATTTMTPNIIRPQNLSVLSQDQPVITSGFKPQPFAQKQQSWQNSQSFQKQQPWQNKANSQMNQNFGQSETSLIDIQQPPLDTDEIQTPTKRQQDFLAQNQVFGNQQRFNQITDMNTQNNQRFGSQSQSWQRPQTFQDQQPFVETSAIPQNANRFLDLPNVNNDVNQVFAFQPRQWQDTSKQTQQSFNINPSSGMQNTQFGFNQQQTTSDQRKTLDSLPTGVSGTWKTRSPSSFA